MKDLIVLVITTIFTCTVLLYVNKSEISSIHEVDKKVLDLSVPLNDTIDTEYLRMRIVLPNE